MIKVDAETPLEFIHAPRSGSFRFVAVSLFSGAGIGDAGIEAAGFRVAAQVEIAVRRCEVARSNFPESRVFESAVEDALPLVETATAGVPIDLLVATPPCQGMSSSNPGRGKRGHKEPEDSARRNSLLLESAPYLNSIKPRAFLAENVRQVLTLQHGGGRSTIQELAALVPGYRFWSTKVNAADYGVAQDRRRALVVGLRRDLPAVALLESLGLSPWPAPTHGPSGEPWVTVADWFKAVGYEPIDSSPDGVCQGAHPLHRVARYAARRYRMVSDIPAGSGSSAYHNDGCPSCAFTPVPEGLASCPRCGSELYNRPIVKDGDGDWRLVKGFNSSYRRMPADHPSATITTNTSHIGSDFKIHPSENRVLSALECADLQTVPRWFDWSFLAQSNLEYTIRVVIGEAFPPFVVAKVAGAIAALLDGRLPGGLASDAPPRLGHRKLGRCRPSPPSSS